MVHALRLVVNQIRILVHLRYNNASANPSFVSREVRCIMTVMVV